MLSTHCLNPDLSEWESFHHKLIWAEIHTFLPALPDPFQSNLFSWFGEGERGAELCLEWVVNS